MPIEEVHWNLARVLGPVIDDFERLVKLSEEEKAELAEYGVNGFMGEHSVTALYVLLSKIEYLASKDLKELRGELNLADEEVARETVLSLIAHDAVELFEVYDQLNLLHEDEQRLKWPPRSPHGVTDMMAAVAHAIKDITDLRTKYKH